LRGAGLSFAEPAPRSFRTATERILKSTGNDDVNLLAATTMNKPIHIRWEAIIAEWNAVNDELHKLRQKATQLQQELAAMKSDASTTPPPKPAPSPPKKSSISSSSSSSKPKSPKPKWSDDENALMYGVSA
jgi:hypothetical protein